MELSDLHIFRTVVEAGGVTGAARRLHRVPSGVTTRVRLLEQELGVELFLRQGNRLVLAPAGHQLLPYAERLLSLASEARGAVVEPTPRGRLRLGAMESTAAVRLPGPLAAYHRRFPAVTIELRTGPSGPLVAAVLAGDLDAALVADAPDEERLARRALFREELALVTEPGRRVTSARDLGNDTVLAFADGCSYRRRLEAWLAEHEVAATRVVPIGSYHAMLGCVVAGMGVAVVPRSVLATLPARRRVAVHPLPRRWGEARTVLVWRRDASSPALVALAEELLRASAAPAAGRRPGARRIAAEGE